MEFYEIVLDQGKMLRFKQQVRERLLSNKFIYRLQRIRPWQSLIVNSNLNHHSYVAELKTFNITADKRLNPKIVL